MRFCFPNIRSERWCVPGRESGRILLRLDYKTLPGLLFLQAYFLPVKNLAEFKLFIKYFSLRSPRYQRLWFSLFLYFPHSHPQCFCFTLSSHIWPLAAWRNPSLPSEKTPPRTAYWPAERSWTIYPAAGFFSRLSSPRPLTFFLAKGGPWETSISTA